MLFIFLGVVLLVGLLWLEVRRSNRKRLVVRVIASVLAVGALVGMSLPGSRSVVDRVEVNRVDSVPGIVKVDWKRRLLKGDSLVVRGKWNGGDAKLLLMGMGEVLDSVSATGEGDSGSGGDFVLHTVPAQSGRAVFSVVAVRGRDTVERMVVPVEVVSGKRLRVLVLASSPGAEHSFLVSWLAKEGNAVASRTMVSKDKYQESFSNMPQRELGQVGVGLLNDFDVAIVDSPFLSLVKKGGVGVIVRDTVSTYPLLLEGKEAEYAKYWSSKLRRVGHVEGAEEVWSVKPAMPRVGDLMELVLQTGAGGIPQGIVDGKTNVYLAQDGVLPFVWSGKFWPEKAGWQSVCTLHGDTSWFYVWKGKPEQGRTAVMVQEKRFTGWFVALFLVSILFLWIEKKFL